MKNAYIELDHLVRAFDEKSSNPLTAGQRITLLEIARRTNAGLQTKATDLVQMIRLGTGPTIHGQLLRLEADGFIERSVSKNDGRAVSLTITTSGLRYLKALDNLVRASVK
jgi:DNA-binding MarR family transcriptional regulator